MKISSVLFFGVTLLSAATSIASAADNVLFYGGSSIHGWNQPGRPSHPGAPSTAPRFPINFGSNVFHHRKEINGNPNYTLNQLTNDSDSKVWSQKPRVVVFYGGENDLAAGDVSTQTDKKAEEVLADFREFVKKRDRSDSKKSAILFISIKPAMDFFYKTGLPTATYDHQQTSERPIGPNTGPAATAAQAAISLRRKNEAWKANRLIKDWIESDDNPHENLHYISIWQTMLVSGQNTPNDLSDDKPNPVYFEDGTHPSRHGFDRWAQVIRPEINRIWDITAPVN